MNMLSNNSNQKTLARWKPIHLIAPLITLLMLMVTFGYWHTENRAAHEARQHVFEEATDQVTRGIQGRLQDFELVLRGFKGLNQNDGGILRALTIGLDLVAGQTEAAHVGKMAGLLFLWHVQDE